MAISSRRIITIAWEILMSLADISINHILLDQTNTLIKISDFSRLRQHLLAKQPIESVINNISLLLSEYCEADKTAYKTQQTTLACEEQIREDIREARTDEYAREQDGLARASYCKELPRLEAKLAGSEREILDQNFQYELTQRRVAELEAELGLLNISMARISSERVFLETPTYHGHPAAHQEMQYHPHARVYATDVEMPLQGYHPSVIHLYPSEWHLVHQRELQLTYERDQLNALIVVQRSQKDREKTTLDEMKANGKRTSDRCEEIRKNLNHVLPKNEQERLRRADERAEREKVRKVDDPHLRQLSSNNLAGLRSKILRQNSILEQIKARLLEQAVSSSYAVFLAQIEQTLQEQNILNISSQERDALHSLIIILKNHQGMEEEVAVIQGALTVAQANLKGLQRKSSENTALFQQNVLLQDINESANNIRTNALYSALFGAGGSLVSAGLVIAYTMNPLFFIIPGALGVLTVTALIIALVYHIEKSDTEHQIGQNNNRIRTNETLPEMDPSLSRAENLLSAIQKAQQKVGQIESNLADKRKEMEQLMGKASNVTASGYSQSPGFGLFSAASAEVKPPTYAEAMKSDTNSFGMSP